MQQQSQNIDYLYVPANKNLQQMLRKQHFWTNGNKVSTYLIKSPLINLTKNQNFEYALTKDGYLLKFGHKINKMCNLYENLIILSFTDKSFQLTTVDRVKEFHCYDQKTLQSWVENLQPFCITRGAIQVKYKILNQLSSGNYSKGYLIEDYKQRQLICKTFRKDDLQKVSKLRDSVIGEMLILRPFDHQNVLKLLEVHEDQKQLYLIYENVKGELFSDFQKKKSESKTYTEDEVSSFMYQIYSGLNYIHSKDVMHRDIKLENILIKDQCNLVIADFGLAAKKISKFEFKKYGTPGYIAPEVLNLKVYNEKVDVFSAGVVAYILLTQKPVFSGQTISSILNSNTAGKIDFNNQKIQSLSDDAQMFLKKVLCLEESQRPSAFECLSLPFLCKQQKICNIEQQQPQKKEIRLSYLGSSVLPQQINLQKAKRKSMRQYILLKQAIITEKQKVQLLQQIQESQSQQEDDEQEKENQDNLIVTESVKNIAGSFYTEGQTQNQNNQDSDSDSGESLNGESSEDEDDSNLFLDDDTHNTLSSKISKLGGIQIKMKR